MKAPDYWTDRCDTCRAVTGHMPDCLVCAARRRGFQCWTGEAFVYSSRAFGVVKVAEAGAVTEEAA
jgi:hypothetical protein